MVHGIPDQRRLQDGEIIAIDSGACWRGYHPRAARTYVVGGEAKHPERSKFSKTMYAALMAGIGKAYAGNRVGDISAAIQAVIDTSPSSLVDTVLVKDYMKNHLFLLTVASILALNSSPSWCLR